MDSKLKEKGGKPTSYTTSGAPCYKELHPFSFDCHWQMSTVPMLPTPTSCGIVGWRVQHGNDATNHYWKKQRIQKTKQGKSSVSSAIACYQSNLANHPIQSLLQPINIILCCGSSIADSGGQSELYLVVDLQEHWVCNKNNCPSRQAVVLQEQLSCNNVCPNTPTASSNSEQRMTSVSSGFVLGQMYIPYTFDVLCIDCQH